MLKKTDELKKTKRICVVNTPFSLFYYLLIFGVNDEDIFIMSYHIPHYIRNNLPHIYFPICELYRFDTLTNVLKNIWLLIRLAYEILKLRIKLFLKTRKFNVKTYGHGHLLFSFPLYEYQNSGIIEDGIGNYSPLPEFKDFPPIKKFLFNTIFGKYVPTLYDGFGTHPNIKEIYLSKKYGWSKQIENKVIVNGIDNLINSIDEKQKNKIIKIFNCNELLDTIKENDILLLTEPFSESLQMTLEEEIKIYKEMISKYNPDQIIIKTHPREKKDYSKYFPNIRVLDKKFPIELFNLMGIKFQKIITIHSSAALNFKDIEVEFYDGTINNENIIKGQKQVKKQYKMLIDEK